ncbi:Vegetative incompatibility protein HET-E-1 [Lachnellula suecica]|uniref:Vegetative incompatibility protein HET-E-1 n=1 Tax=Lachnellula suecica TaxID=602035 RepID=A0A8T9CE04_9HELO|nr:Vegetative incompatibility protein HET-E-1 [Lachnellula suecica]
MRLINTSTLSLHDFTLAKTPPYAILSHTWGSNETTFQEISKPPRQRVASKGYAKIEKTCELAREDGLEFAWVDTCCIDKSSSAELTESINSMFQWYEAAAVCYVALEDLPPDVAPGDGFPKCRWLKSDFVDIIGTVTGVPVSLLMGGCGVKTFSVAERMSWAASRQTTRREDMGYCLLGIFDVNMPLIYGEGIKAFRRLQEEIVKHNNDMTIFAWERPSQQCSRLGLFAHSPQAFAGSAGIVPFSDDFLDFSVSNKGLFRPGDSVQRIASVKRSDHPDGDTVRYLINLGIRRDVEGAEGGIYLRKIGPNLFHRDSAL